MGLFTGLLLLPLAPVQGVAWVAGQLEKQAYDQLYSPAAIRAQLGDLEAALEAGELSEEEFERYEGELLDRLDEAMQRDEEQWAS